jgi:hypothetical protein
MEIRLAGRPRGRHSSIQCFPITAFVSRLDVVASARKALGVVIVEVVIALAGLAFAERSYGATTYQVPDSIAGDCSVDVSQPLQAWIASVPDDSIVSFNGGACYRIEGTLELDGRSGLDFEGNGATLKATTTGDDSRSQWRVVGGSGIVFRNMTVQGGNPLGGTFVSTFQHQHAFDLAGADNVDIDHVSASDLYGDCVYVGQGWDAAKSWSSNVHVHDSSCARNGRMGIAVTAGRNVLVERTSLSQIALTAFDIEPNGAGFGGSNITFVSNRVSGTLTSGFFSAIGDGPVDSVTVSDNTLTGEGMHMTVVAPEGQRRSNITITGNSSDTGYFDPGGAALDFMRVDSITVTGNNIPLSGLDMALAEVSESCNVNISGNSFPGGVVEARIAPYSSCPTEPAPSPTNQAPTVELTAPAEGATFTSNLTITADARDDEGVSRVEFWAGNSLLSTDYSAPYSYTWHLRGRKSAFGQYTITARAFDGPGLSASDSVTATRLMLGPADN